MTVTPRGASSAPSARASRVGADGFFPTADGGFVDEEGYLFLEGRIDDVIVRGGEVVAHRFLQVDMPTVTEELNDTLLMEWYG